MNVLLAGDIAPTEVLVVGNRMLGALPVAYALTSALTRSVRFGGYRFGLGHTIEVNGIVHDIASLTVVDSERGWHVSSYGAVRRLNDSHCGYEDASESVRTKVHAWAVTTATELAEQHPAAFDGKFGFYDRDDQSQYRTSNGMKLAAERHAEDAWMYAQYASIAEMVELGHATVEADDVGLVRWRTPHGTDHGQLGAMQPRPAVGRIMYEGERIGVAVDVRSRGWGNEPDTGSGPLLVPIELCESVAR